MTKENETVEEIEEVEFEPRPERIRLYSAAKALEQAQALMQRRNK